jgi:hypothetical protein
MQNLFQDFSRTVGDSNLLFFMRLLFFVDWKLEESGTSKMQGVM